MRACVYPVIHHADGATTLAQAALALSLGADGVFLISHGGSDFELPSLAHAIMARHPEKIVGLNFLSLSATESLEWCIREGFQAVWVDDAGITSQGASQEGQAFAKRAAAHGLKAFASVAFKYQKAEPNPGLAAHMAAVWNTIPTTSGPGTGQAPEIDKIAAMRSALRPTDRLALASGMTPDNVLDFLPFATDFLVATGVSADMHHFDAAKLGAFIRRVQQAS